MTPFARRDGTSFVEIVFTLGLVSTIVGLSLPVLTHGVEGARSVSAARYLAFQLRLARVSAVARGRTVGLRFEPDGTGFWTMTPYVDGDGDGVRTADIRSAVDLPIGPPDRLGDKFPGMRFGIMAGVRGITGDALDPGDPLTIGRSDIVSFTPRGTASSGTLYLHGRRTHQYAVRILGVTGRVRLLAYSFASGRWTAR
jgi:hypothetical protein